MCIYIYIYTHTQYFYFGQLLEGGNLKTKPVKKMYEQCKNAETFVPFYIKPKHVHLLGKSVVVWVITQRLVVISYRRVLLDKKLPLLTV